MRSLSRHLPTIFAPATPNLKSAISILRISGPDALQVYHQMTLPAKSAAKVLPERDPIPRKALLRKIVHPNTKEVLDEGIVLYFPSESSLTALPTLELHLHGSIALMLLLLKTLPTLSPSFRIAEPGEFTKLAFEAGKMDLTEVEGLRDLIDANTEIQRRQASRQAAGEMRKIYDDMRSTLIDATALVEAVVDFGEDQGIDEAVFGQSIDIISRLRSTIQHHLNDQRRGEIIRSGIQLVILGAPNAGKSSLLNWLAQREAAIVTSTPGTTRDIIELSLNFHGFPIQVADTAGLRKNTTDEIELIGIQRAGERARDADLKLCVLSLDQVFKSGSPYIDSLTLDHIDSSSYFLLNKTDLLEATPDRISALTSYLVEKTGQSLSTELVSRRMFPVSINDSQGLDVFSSALKKDLEAWADLDSEPPLVTQERHRICLQQCGDALNAFIEHGQEDIVIAAENLRYATASLGKIAGIVDVEEVLGAIFSGFCIGK